MPVRPGKWRVSSAPHFSMTLRSASVVRLLLDALGQLPGQRAPEIISDLAVYAPVTEDPDLSLKEGDEDEDARFPLRPVSAFLIEAVDRPLPHRVLDPLLVEKGELQMGEPSE